jgi:hypothetical protein
MRREQMHVNRNPGRIEPVSWRIYFVTAALMIVIALAHVFAFEKLNAARTTPDRLNVLGE